MITVPFFFIFFHLFIWKRERAQAGGVAEGEAGSTHREPDVGFDPGSPGSRPGPKAGAKPLHHPGIPGKNFIKHKTDSTPSMEPGTGFSLATLRS